MSDPKLDENVPAWKYLDIFLFSNGQENSPPRKYHLIANDLEVWNNTLKKLSQEQYPNESQDNNITIYTTLGQLIQSPLELRHNKAYVAVKSHEDFINAGYDRYLIKASRSWEKRQDKRSFNTTEQQDEDLSMGKSEPELVPSLTLKTIVPSTADNIGSVMFKTIRNISNAKPLDRDERNFTKRSSLSKKRDSALSPAKSIKTPTQRRDSNLHNDVTTDQSMSSKSSFKGRVPKVFQKRKNSDAVLLRVEEVVNHLENTSPKNVEQVNAKLKRSENRSQNVMNKPIESEKDQNKPQTNPHMTGNRPRILMTKPGENEKDQQRAKLKPFSNSSETRNTNSGKHSIIERNKSKIMPHLKENPLDTEAVNPNLDGEQHFNESDQILSENLNMNENVINRNENVVSLKTPFNISNNNKINQQYYNNEIVPNDLPTEKKQEPRDSVYKADFFSNTKNTDDLLKKKGILSPPPISTTTNTLPNFSQGVINMRIEVWKSSDATENASCDIKAPVIILTNEIGSQVDMTGQTGQSKDLNQVIASDKEGNYKVLLVRSCYSNNNACESSKYSVIGDCIMFLPVIKLDELYCRCVGDETKDINTKDISSVYNVVKKSPSCTSIHKENANGISITSNKHHENIKSDSARFNHNEDTIPDKTKTDSSPQKLSTYDKQFEETPNNFESLPPVVDSVKRTSKGIILNQNVEPTNSSSKPKVPLKPRLVLKEDEQKNVNSVMQPANEEYVESEEPKSKSIKKEDKQKNVNSVSELVDSEYVESEEPKSKTIKMLASQSQDLEKHIETKTDESVEKEHSKIEEIINNAPEVASALAKSSEMPESSSATSVVSKACLRESEEITLQSNELRKTSAVTEATSLLETRLESAKPQDLTQDKATQTEWTDMLWEARLLDNGYYSFILPTLSRLKEYNL